MSEKISIANLGNGIFQLTIDDPNTQNRISAALCDQYLAALGILAADPALKVLILGGSREVFCAGASLEFIRQLEAQSTNEALIARLAEQTLRFPLPLIGALEGHAVGGGLILGLCCDLVVAAEDRRYGLNFTSLGLTPGMGTTSLLPALVGHHFASEMLLTARFYKGRELKGRGLFNTVVPAAQVQPTAVDLACSIAEKPRHILKMLKDTLAITRLQGFQEAVAREALMHRLCFNDPHTMELIDDTYIDKPSVLRRK
jgi:polyketide biosynthesis enoyl-CoA hydratase PksI